MIILLTACFVFCGSAQIVIGHRGDPTLCPENTMPSFESAVEAGVQGVESDLRLTKDGVVVLMHDATLDRTTNCTGAVSDWTFADLQAKCDAGTWFSAKFAGTRVPSFKEMLTYIRDKSDYVMVMDIKQHGIAKQIADVVLSLEMQARVIASCWIPQDAIDLSQLLNITVKQKLGSLPNPLPKDWLFQMREDGFHALSVNQKSAPAGFYLEAAKNLMPLFYWTVDTKEDLQKAHHQGASVISNVCRLAKTVFSQ